jgi:NADH dehydrogenase
VDDLAKLCVEQGKRRENVVIDAVGPETFTYRELVRTIGAIIGRKRPVVGVPPRLGHAVAWLAGKFVGDVIVTWEEIQGLKAGLLYTESPPAGETRLTEWAREHREGLGREYASELARRQDRESAYENL